jgi:predicted RNA methylase
MAKRIDTEVLLALRQARTEDTGLWLTGQLERKLYERVNKVLEALGGRWSRKLKRHVFDGQAADLLGDVLTTGEYVDMKQEFQFFETPSQLASRMCSLAQVNGLSTVLEPSAGRGAIAKMARSYGAVVECIELQEKLAEELRQQAFKVIQGDFLDVSPAEPRYKAVLMNPPFCRSQDIAHVRHAYEFLKPGGTLVAVMGAGWTFRQDRRATEFREWLDDHGGEVEPLPQGTFKESGTGVNTVLVTIRRP